MRILFIGGTGNISGSCSLEALAKGHELWLLTRGKRGNGIPGAKILTADIHDEAATEATIKDLRFDAVVDFIAFTVEDVERDLRLFAKRCGQYVFISSASCYAKPLPIPVRETSPVGNPFWAYSHRKVLCEERLWRARDAGVGVTVIRPSHTYATIMPLPFAGNWTGCARMLAGKPLILPGDGTSIWTVTHSDDLAVALVGLLGNPKAMGEDFHITGDELLTWEGIHRELASALGVDPVLVTVTSAALVADDPARAGGLLGDKTHSAIFDNAKVKAAVPGFRQSIPFNEGIRRTIAWFRADPTRLVVKPETDAWMDRIAAGIPRSPPATP